jgi:hypothetical protein
MVLFTRDPDFIGRGDIIGAINQHLNAADKNTRVALIGTGGVG